MSGKGGERVAASQRVVMHVDMDAFFAAVEQRDDPTLRGKPVIVGGGRGGGDPNKKFKRGVVTTASYEARAFGCRSAMPMATALKLCPHAVVAPVRMGVYSAVGKAVVGVLRELSPDVEPVSIDEAFVEATGVLHLHRGGGGAADDPFVIGERIGREIKSRIRERVDLPATVGVAPNKFLAKVASDAGKPDGLMVIRPGDVERLLAPMSVRVIHGIGPAAAEDLERVGLRTIADLRAFGEQRLIDRFGQTGEHWWRCAWGRDDAPVRAERSAAKSISKERTFGDDVSDADRLRAVLLTQVEDVARSLREDQLVCARVGLKLRTPDFRTFSRSSVIEPTDVTAALWAAARELFDTWRAQHREPLRLVGVALQQLSARGQMSLFAGGEDDRARRVDAAADAVVRKFGDRAVRRGGGL